MSTTITGVVKNGVVVPESPLPEGARVAIHLMPVEGPSANPLLNFHGHLDPNDEVEIEFQAELARLKREDLERTLREYDQNAPVPLRDRPPDPAPLAVSPFPTLVDFSCECPICLVILGVVKSFLHRPTEATSKLLTDGSLS